MGQDERRSDGNPPEQIKSLEVTLDAAMARHGRIAVLGTTAGLVAGIVAAILTNALSGSGFLAGLALCTVMRDVGVRTIDYLSNRSTG